MPFITVIANNGNHGALHRAGRKLVNGHRYRFEVVADKPSRVPDVDPVTREKIFKAGPPDPREPFERDGVTPSMSQICEAGVKLMEADGRISIHKGNADNDAAAAQVVAALRSQLADKDAEITLLLTQVAELEGEKTARSAAEKRAVDAEKRATDAEAKLSKAEKRVADVEAKLAKADAPKGDAPKADGKAKDKE
jgi:hypothetical protein